jgi:hypothetical protein
MYTSSASYKTAIAAAARTTRITGTLTLADLTTRSITDADIVQGSLKISDQIVTGDDLEIGNVYAQEMQLSLITPSVSPWDLKGSKLALSFGLDISGVPTWEDIPLGVFNVIDIKRHEGFSELVAYDNMVKLDVARGATNVTGRTIQQLITDACATAGITLATLTAEFNTFANYTMSLTLPSTSSVRSCRDIIMWACQIAGTFARFNRAGALEIKAVYSATARTITETERYAPTRVEDTVILTTGVGMQVLDTQYQRGTLALYMALPSNPFLESQSASAINTALDNILTKVALATYTPFSIKFIGDPTLQAGDYITLADTGSLTGNPTGLVTHSDWAYRGVHTLRSAGKPSLAKYEMDQNGKRITALSADLVTTRTLIVTLAPNGEIGAGTPFEAAENYTWNQYTGKTWTEVL